MITRQFSINQMPLYPFEQMYNLKQLAFFDIETTGFAAETSYLYLIGCAYYKDSDFCMTQWFSEGIQEEALLITSFFEFLSTHHILIHYNGNGFDLPFLERKCKMLGLDYSFKQFESIDLYKCLLPYKKVLNLQSLKLKAIEKFLGISRKDTFDGGDLIGVYQSYLGKKNFETLRQRRNPSLQLTVPTESDQLLEQLLLHNEDDIRGLLRVSQILHYADLFVKPVRILQANIIDEHLSIEFELSMKLPSPVRFGNDLAHLSAYEHSATLMVRTYEGTLKHFYDNYKDYYYLPLEDYALHKTLATYVDKNHRVKAKPSTCYIKKEGLFVPQYEPLLTPFFKLNHTDKLSFLEVHTDYLLREESLEQYVHSMMGWMVKH